jgi:tetratricopeptide (TPR) repeat protein
VTENTSFQDLYQAGIAAFERGQYRLSIEQLNAALALIPSGSRDGGEIQIWLISAYQGLGEGDKASDICKQLITHPIYQIREQAKRLLYIIEAPRLKRPDEWMTKIPDLEKLPDSSPQFKKGSTRQKKEELPAPMQLDQQRDNRFIWVAIGIILLMVLFYANYG